MEEKLNLKCQTAAKRAHNLLAHINIFGNIKFIPVLDPGPLRVEFEFTTQRGEEIKLAYKVMESDARRLDMEDLTERILSGLLSNLGHILVAEHFGSTED